MHKEQDGKAWTRDPYFLFMHLGALCKQKPRMHKEEVRLSSVILQIKCLKIAPKRHKIYSRIQSKILNLWIFPWESSSLNYFQFFENQLKNSRKSGFCIWNLELIDGVLPYACLPSQVPDLKFEIFVRHLLYIKSNGRNCGDDFTHLKIKKKSVVCFLVSCNFLCVSYL